MGDFGDIDKKITPRAFGDLRGWIDALREAGELHEIDAEVDWDCELGAIARKVFGQGDGPAILFKRIKDYGAEDDVWSRQVFTGGQSNYSRLKMMLGLSPESTVTDMVQAARHSFTNRMDPVQVETGPVKENIYTGEDIDLYKIPAPRWHGLDGGRYINTYQGTVTIDPDTGQHNIGIYRGMLGEHPDTLPVQLWRAQHWGVHFRKWADKGMKMPVAHVYGWEPVLPFCASAPLPTGVSEYEAMSALRGKPVELVKCETSDILVPASAEIVVEGYIDPDPETFEMEGPFGEYTGYFGGDQCPKHVTKVTAVTMRDKPIFRGTLEGTLPKQLNENSVMSSIQRAAVAWNVLTTAGVPGVTDVHCPPANNGTTLIIQLHQTYRGQAKQAAAAIWGSNSSHLRFKHVWVVDEDIDIHDYGSLDWAFAYRVNAAEDDIVFFPATFGSLLDPSTRLEERNAELFGTGKWCRVLIDATRNLDFRPQEQYDGDRFPPTVEPLEEHKALVAKRWKEYGF
jgi:4-hydroxy-3-polyprenylbenzoate decarboxylase